MEAISILAFIFTAVAISYWWLWRQRIFDKPWVEEGTEADDRETIGGGLATANTALFAFLAVVTSLFALFISAYFTRMELNDWSPLTEPSSLWFNTGILMLASVSVHWCTRTINKTTYKAMLLATGVFTFGFIWGQYAAWQQLWAAGYYLNTNPANSFFFLFTALHALHLFGGLWVWTRATFRVFTDVDVEKAKMSVELCRTYWHFLLIVWLVLFALLLST